MTSIAWCGELRKRVGDVKPGECKKSCGDCGKITMLSKAEIRDREAKIILEREQSKQWVDFNGRAK